MMLFKYWTDLQIKLFAYFLKIKEVNIRELVYKEKDHPDCFYIIKTGEFRVKFIKLKIKFQILNYNIF